MVKKPSSGSVELPAKTARRKKAKSDFDLKTMQVGRRKNPKSDFDLKSTKPSRRGGGCPDFRKIILGVVVINILIVVGVVVAYFQLLPKYRVPATIDALAHKYYENVFYENMVT
jgi:hypothetical protein